MNKPYGIISIIKLVFSSLFNLKDEKTKRFLPSELVYEIFKEHIEENKAKFKGE